MLSWVVQIQRDLSSLPSLACNSKFRRERNQQRKVNSDVVNQSWSALSPRNMDFSYCNFTSGSQCALCTKMVNKIFKLQIYKWESTPTMVVNSFPLKMENISWIFHKVSISILVTKINKRNSKQMFVHTSSKRTSQNFCLLPILQILEKDQNKFVWTHGNSKVQQSKRSKQNPKIQFTDLTS